jgi:hypothetical protein
VSWDASSQVALLDSDREGRRQRLEHGRDWVEADRIVFEAQSRKAVFEGGVKAHLEEVSKAPGGKEKFEKTVEPPFEMASGKLTVQFGQEYHVREAVAEGSVEFTGSSKGLVLKCERARYVRGEQIVFEGKSRPELISGRNRLSARTIVAYLTIGRVVFLEKIAAGFDDGKGAAMVVACDKMVALYDRKSGGLTEVYFEDNVRIESESEEAGKITADGEQAVYEVEKGQISLRGRPVVVKQRAVTVKEERVVYDAREKVLFTRPGEKGYDWIVNPGNWKKDKK